MDPNELGNLKNFLLLFNRLSERCFQRCVYTLGQVTLTGDEKTCIDSCLTKNVNSNQKIMSLYMEINPPFQQKKMEEQMAKMKEMQDAQESSSAVASTSSNSIPEEQSPSVVVTGSEPEAQTVQ